jgi:hypothetical protein
MICPDCGHLWAAHFDARGQWIDCEDDRPEGHVCGSDCLAQDTRLPLNDWLRLRWWGALAWLHRCPECRRRPYGRESWMPRWEDDKIAQALGIVQGRCPDCGKHEAAR